MESTRRAAVAYDIARSGQETRPFVDQKRKERVFFFGSGKRWGDRWYIKCRL